MSLPILDDVISIVHYHKNAKSLRISSFSIGSSIPDLPVEQHLRVKPCQRASLLGQCLRAYSEEHETLLNVAKLLHQQWPRCLWAFLEQFTARVRARCSNLGLMARHDVAVNPTPLHLSRFAHCATNRYRITACRCPQPVASFLGPTRSVIILMRARVVQMMLIHLEGPGAKIASQGNLPVVCRGL